jgi:hypothetical protein
MSGVTLPFASEFSPSQMDLARALDLAKQNRGDVKALQAALLKAFFATYSTNDKNKNTLAMNCRLGMQSYGLLDRAGILTELGEKLWRERNNKKSLHDELAKQVLVHLNGLALINCIQDMDLAGESVTLNSLRQALELRGITFPRGGKHPSIMRLWLEQAGVFSSGWRVDEARLTELLRVSTGEIDELAMLTREQRVYLRTLANLGAGAPFGSNEVEKLAATTYAIRFDEKNLPKQVLYPLEAAGYITLVRGTKAPGRGAKPFLVQPTAKLETDVLIPLLTQIENQTGWQMRSLLRKSWDEVLTELKDNNKHVRGLALEALAFKLMRLIDLDYKATRLRGIDTGGAEVDLVFESTRLQYTRWQLQCKNTQGGVTLEDIAKEIGLQHSLKSNVIVIVSTGAIGKDARSYAASVMRDSNLAIVLIDGTDIERIKTNPPTIVDVLNREATNAARRRALQLKTED